MSEVYTPFEQRIVDGYLKATYPDEPAAPDLQEAATMMTLPEDAKNIPLSTFGKMAMDVPAGLAKGAVQGTIGLPGDLISLGRGIAAAINPNAGEGRLDAFLRGTKGATILPTTEDVKKFLDETLGVPLVPAGEIDQIRRESAGVTETVGELFGGGKTALGLGKATAQAGAAIGRELAPKAGEMAEDLLRKQGLLLDVVPENKFINREAFTAYANQPKQLQGFRKNAPAKSFDEQKYKHVEFVEVKLDDGTTFLDAIRGLNRPHALSRAFGNWPAAGEIKLVPRSEAIKSDPELVKDVDEIMSPQRQQ
jgi:hypothetical protein